MKPWIAALLMLALALPAWAKIEQANGGHDGGPKAHESGQGGADPGHDGPSYDGDPNSVLEGGMCCGRKTPIGTDENGNPSQDTPGLGPDWDPYRDDVNEPDDPSIDWGWDE